MAVSANTVWAFSSSATGGAMTNGGGFVTGATGTDWTLTQNGPKYALSGVTSAGAGNTCSHASAAADWVGNIIHVVSGTNFTSGASAWFEIVSVVAGVSFTCGTNAAGTAISTGVGASGVMNIGGPLVFGSATLDTGWAAQPQPGNIVYIKNGAYTIGSAIAAGTAGASNNPVKWVGFNSTPGDVCTGTNRPVITVGANTWTWAANHELYNLNFTGTVSAMCTTGANTKLVNCKFTNTSTTAGRSAVSAQAQTYLLNCELQSLRGTAVASATAVTMIGCYVHDSDIGLSSTSTANAYVLINNIFSDNVSNAVRWTGASQTGSILIYGNTFYGAENKLGTGITFVTGTVHDRVMNNIFYGFATAVTNAEVGQAIGYDDFNDYFNNTTDNTNWTKGANDLALNPSFTAVTQYTATNGTTAGSVITSSGASFPAFVPGADFVYIKSGTGVTVGKYGIVSNTATAITLDSAPGADATADKVFQVTTGHNFSVGSALAAVGFPGAYPAGLTTSYTDIGAAQRINGAGYTDPGIANVKTGTGYTFAGSGLTGTYDGSDRWTDPGIANVRLTTAYKANSTSNNRTGTLDLPAVTDVKSGVVFDGGTKTGTLVSPTAADIADAVWDEATSGHVTVGSFGSLVQKLLTVAKFLGLK